MDDFWRFYLGMRVLALGSPLGESEESGADETEKALQDWLRLNPQEASYHARRRLLHRREEALHELLAHELPPAQLSELLDTVIVEGLEHLREARQRGGVLCLSLHYSLYSSVLLLWLARAVGQGLFSHVAVLYWATADGAPSTLEGAMQRAEAAEFAPRSSLRLIDLGAGPIGATRELLRSLAQGAVGVVFSDRVSPSGPDARTVTVSLGRRQLGIAHGVPWLVHAARCPVLPVYVRPAPHSRHAIVFGAPEREEVDGDAPTIVKSLMQSLLDQTVLTDPALWDVWPSLARFGIDAYAR